EDDMVTVPPDAAADMQQQSRHELKHGADLVRERLCRMKMARIQAEQHLMPDGVAEIELVGAGHIGLRAEPKQLALDRVQAVSRIDSLRQDGVQRGGEPLAGGLPVDREILV